MEIKNGPLSVFQLIRIGLKTTNQAFGAALALFIVIALLNVFIAAVGVGVSFVFGYKSVWVQAITGIFHAFLNVVFMIALIQILASKIEKSGFTFGETIQTSVVPAFYLIVSSVLLMIPVVLVGIAAGMAQTAWVTILSIVVLGFLLLPFIFVQAVLALREEGPIGALQYSWQLGIAHYGRILWTIFAFWLIATVSILALVCLLKMLLPTVFVDPGMLQFQIMMWMAQAPKLYAFLIGLVVLSLYAYVFLVIQSIYTAFFLSLDYTHHLSQNRDADAKTENAIPAIPPMAITPELVVKQASVETETDEHTELHLEQVYSASDHTPQILEQEEDRMPTILFDEDMKKQLAENERKIKEQKEKSEQKKDSEDEQGIKISHRPHDH